MLATADSRMHEYPGCLCPAPCFPSSYSLYEEAVPLSPPCFSPSLPFSCSCTCSVSCARTIAISLSLIRSLCVLSSITCFVVCVCVCTLCLFFLLQLGEVVVVHHTEVVANVHNTDPGDPGLPPILLVLLLLPPFSTAPSLASPCLPCAAGML